MMTLCLALLLGVAVQDDKEADKAATEALDKFQKAFKGGDDERKAAVVELAKVQHPKVITKLGSILAGNTPTPVRFEVVKALAGFADHKKPATAALANAVPANAKEPALLTQMFDAIARLQDPSAVPLMVRYYDDKELLIAQSAIQTTGKLDSAAAIEPLIAVLARNEKAAKPPGANVGVSTNGTNPNNQSGGVVVSGGGSGNNAARDRAQTIAGVANGALQELTKQNLSTAEAWNVWWAKNKATFKK